jgi:transposase
MINSVSHDSVSCLVADRPMCFATALDKAFENIDCMSAILRCQAKNHIYESTQRLIQPRRVLWFAALEVATGKIIATHSKRRRRVEFLDFMNSVTAAFPNRQLHVILDNLNTHKKNEHWLKAHPNVQFHFTPTRASWLNQVEVWFSILQGQSLSGASFTSLKQVQQHIDAYINAYNNKAEPFVWTKKKVRQRRFKGRRITQL